MTGDYPFSHFPTNGRKLNGEGSGGDAPVPTWVRILIVVVPWLLLIVLYYFYTNEPEWDIKTRYPLLFFCFCTFVAAIIATIAAVYMLGSSNTSPAPANVFNMTEKASKVVISSSEVPRIPQQAGW